MTFSNCGVLRFMEVHLHYFIVLHDSRYFIVYYASLLKCILGNDVPAPSRGSGSLAVGCRR